MTTFAAVIPALLLVVAWPAYANPHSADPMDWLIQHVCVATRRIDRLPSMIKPKRRELSVTSWNDLLRAARGERRLRGANRVCADDLIDRPEALPPCPARRGPAPCYRRRTRRRHPCRVRNRHAVFRAGRQNGRVRPGDRGERGGFGVLIGFARQAGRVESRYI
jgi:hypothetical protein